MLPANSSQLLIFPLHSELLHSQGGAGRQGRKRRIPEEKFCSKMTQLAHAYLQCYASTAHIA